MFGQIGWSWLVGKRLFEFNSCDFFTKTGWNYSLEQFNLHIGEVNSVYKKCFNKMLNFENQPQSIQVVFNKQSEKTRYESWIRLEASTNVAKFLLKFELSFIEVMMKVRYTKNAMIITFPKNVNLSFCLS